MASKEVREMIAILGAAGYLGDCAVKLALGCNYKVLAIDNLLYGGRYDREHPNLIFKRADVRDTKQLKELFISHDVKEVIHLAAIVGDGACAVNPTLTVAVNEVATKNIAEICASLGARLIFASTCSVYGAADSLIDENSPTNPLSLYAGTKLAAEEYVRQVPNHYIFRLGTLFGRSAEFGRLRCDLVTNILTFKAVEGQKLTIFGGQQWRPLLHVQDAAYAMVRCSSWYIRPRVGTYNLACGNFTVLEIAQTIIDTLNLDPSTAMEITENKFEDLRNYRVSTEKAAAAGFIPMKTLKEGILELAAKARSGSVADLWDKVYHNALYIKDRYETVPN